MASKQSTNVWKNAIDLLHFTDTIESIKEKIDQLDPNYSFEQFIKDCEAFYEIYIDFIGFNDDKSPNKNLQIQFHKVARLLNMYGHQPDEIEEQATESMFDYLTSVQQTPQTPQDIKTANSHTDQDDFYTEDNLAFGLQNNMPTDKVDLVSFNNGKPSVVSCRVLNVKVASEELGYNKDYIKKLAELYKIGDNLLEVKFNKDNFICSLYYK